MRKIYFSLIVVFLASLTAFAQKTISGKITDDTGEGLPGVNVVIKGTTTGVTTDLDGNYQISVPNDNTVLVFSSVGMATQEVSAGVRTTVDLQMAPDTTELQEIVVTAIGVERSSRSIGYSATTVGNESITQGRSSSVLSSLQGKVAGAQISGSSGAPGSSSKVIIRGYTSLSGGNNPLYVVDGVPINNTFTGNTTLNGASDFGSRINDLNPEDIASVTVLKGAAATALYGSRAASGVIIVTTKNGSGTKDEKLEVTFASSIIFDSVLKLPDYQNVRGQGLFGSTSRFFNENLSWGSLFTGEDQTWGRIANDQQRVKPFVALEDNVREFLERGKTFTNSLSLQGGSEESNYYLSFSNVTADGIMPTDADSYIRNTLSVRGSTRLANNLSSSASLNYARTESSFVPTGQGATVWNNVLQTPRDIPLLELEDINNPFNDPIGYYSEFTNNPYQVLKTYGSEAVIDRLYGNVQLGYEVTDWMSATLRVGSDIARTEWEQFQPVQVITGPNAGNSTPGNYSIQTLYSREFNSDFILSADRPITSTLNANVLVGWNVNQRQSQNIFTQINDLVLPGFYNIGNTANTPSATTAETMRRLYGVYGQVDLVYKDYLFLTMTARNDWSSTLPSNNNSFFYPGVNMAMDVTSALGVDNNILSYAKVRGGWAQVGKDANPYSVQSVFVSSAQTDGFITLNAPFAQNIPAFEVSNIIGNPNLQPEISSEIELGADLRFLGNRLGLDIAVYKRKVEENILTVPLAASTGFTSQVLNIAKLTNRGVEILITGTPVRAGDFEWNISANYSKNKSRIADLGGPEQISVGGLGGNSLIARLGGQAFEVEGNVPVTDPNGNIVVDAAGEPITEQAVIGNTGYDWVGGLTNSFSYKGLALGVTFDVRKGGVMYSRTASLGYFAGTAPQTLYNDRKPFIIPNSVVQSTDAGGNLLVDENGNPVYEENTQQLSHYDGNLQNFWSNGGFDQDKSLFIKRDFVKLREVVLSYAIPESLLSKTPFGSIDVSLIGRNLLLWVPDENLFIDPEQTTFGTDIGSEFGEFGSSPTTRSYGASIRMTF